MGESFKQFSVQTIARPEGYNFPIGLSTLVATTGGDVTRNVAETTNGGTQTIDGSNTVHAFSSNAASAYFSSNTGLGYGLVAEVLAIAGGGGGGWDGGGGGGAGGLYYTNSAVFSNGVIHTVTIASGGAGDTSGSVRGTVGSNTSITYRGPAAPVTGNVVAEGGGGGGSAPGQSGQTGGPGGSGGGGNIYNAAGGATSNSAQGSAGGTGAIAGPLASGRGAGGGGAGGVGADGTVPGTGGAGGVGLFYSISGSNTGYAGGASGGGSGYAPGHIAGVSQPTSQPSMLSASGPYGGGTNDYGGGMGGGYPTFGSPNQAYAGGLNSGGGGGGGGGGTGAGLNGGSGVVYIRYITSNTESTLVEAEFYSIGGANSGVIAS